MFGIAGVSLLLSIRILLVGWLWSGRFLIVAKGEQAGLIRVSVAVSVGVVIQLLSSLLLAGFGVWTPAMDWVLWIGLVGIGVLRGGMSRSDVLPFARAGLLLFSTILISGLLPIRSNWLAGGWDPGLYQNYALSIARRGSLQAERGTLYASLSKEDRERLSPKTEKRYREIFPGVPIRVEDGSLPVYFYHGTSVWGAWVFRQGGLDWLLRLSCLSAWLGIWPMLALLALLGLDRREQWVGLCFLLLTPLWWYQQAVPTSEILALFLLLAVSMLYFLEQGRKRVPWLLALTLFCGVVNHVGFVILISVPIVLAAFSEGVRKTPGRRIRLIASLSALALGLLWSLVMDHTTLMRLQDKDHILSWVLVAYLFVLLGGGMGIICALSDRWMSRLQGFCRWILIASGVITLCIGFTYLYEPLRLYWMRRAWEAGRIPMALITWSRLIPFMGVAAWSLIASGWIALGLRKDEGARRVQWFTLTCLAVLGVLLCTRGIYMIFPWAFRRYFVWLIPVFLLGQISAVRAGFLHPLTSGRVFRIGAVLLIAGAVWQGVSYTIQASRLGDYRGLAGPVREWVASLPSDAVVVVDDPRWGTPLLLGFGLDTINGSLLWKSQNPAYQQAFVDLLRRVQTEQDRRVFWLTSTQKDLQVYPLPLGEMKPPLMDAQDYTSRTVAHRSKGARWLSRPHHSVFVLQEWEKENPCEPE